VANKAQLNTNTSLTNTLQTLPTRTAPKQNSDSKLTTQTGRYGNRPEVSAGKGLGRDEGGGNVSTVWNVNIICYGIRVRVRRPVP
jgi:hypothetical protein